MNTLPPGYLVRSYGIDCPLSSMIYDDLLIYRHNYTKLEFSLAMLKNQRVYIQSRIFS